MKTKCLAVKLKNFPFLWDFIGILPVFSLRGQITSVFLYHLKTICNKFRMVCRKLAQFLLEFSNARMTALWQPCNGKFWKQKAIYMGTIRTWYKCITFYLSRAKTWEGKVIKSWLNFVINLFFIFCFVDLKTLTKKKSSDLKKLILTKKRSVWVRYFWSENTEKYTCTRAISFA